MWSRLMRLYTGTPWRCSTSCIADSAPLLRSSRSSATTTPAASAPAARMSVSDSATEVPAEITSSAISSRPRRGAHAVRLQETKPQEHQLPPDVLQPVGYRGFLFDAQKKGYSGVAVYTRRDPDRVQAGLGWSDFDAEGRF